MYAMNDIVFFFPHRFLPIPEDNRFLENDLGSQVQDCIVGG